MKLVTKQIAKKLSKYPLNSTDGQQPKDAVVKFFTPWTYWTWYVTEFDGKDTFFGFVEGHDKEWGYFSLSELESIKGPFGMGVERDIFFDNKKIDENGEGYGE